MAASDKVTFSAISPEQSRAARGLLDWSRDQLADRCGVAKRTIVRFEASDGETRPPTIVAIRAALEAAGVEFIDQNGGGPGVRLRGAGAPKETPSHELRSVGPEDETRGGPQALEAPEVQTDD